MVAITLLTGWATIAERVGVANDAVTLFKLGNATTYFNNLANNFVTEDMADHAAVGYCLGIFIKANVSSANAASKNLY